MNNRKSVIGLLAVLMALMLIAGPAAAQPGADAGAQRIGAATAGTLADTAAQGDAVYIVKFTDPAIASYTGGVDGLAATSPQATGARKLDTDSAASQAYREYLAGRHDAFLAAAGEALGRSLEVRFQYFNALNGMAVVMNPAEAAIVSVLPGVRFVEREVEYQLTTDVGPTWIGAPGIWEGNTTSGLGTMGEGVIVGVLDTGINAEHPSFAATGGDGYTHTNPFGAGVYVGVCDPGDPSFDPSFVCNAKLIGAWSFVNEPTTPEDSDGHGSHTASTAAGNFVDATVVGPTLSYVDTISGVAPHANVIAYDVCVASCPGAALLGGINQSIADGVDVINYSISGSDQPWSDGVELAFLDAFNAGVFVSASAGNSGPGASTAAHTSPWVMSVAAGTHNRLFAETLFGMSGGTGAPADMKGAGFTSGYGPANIVYAGDFGDAQCLNPFPGGTWTNGEIVVCDRGSIARVQKGANALAGGAAGFVLANIDANGESVNGDAHFLPAVHLGDNNSDTLRAWLATTGSPQMASISGTQFDNTYDVANGDKVASFSSRGPSQYDILAPNVIAPGVDILAAYCKGCTAASPDYAFISGTSMSSPHDAGAAALMVALNPSWTPDMIKSAMMSTAYTGASLVEADGVTPADPFDVGAGRLDMGQAGNAGFVLMESGADMLAADPNNSGDPRTLNLAHLVDQNCSDACSFTREVTSVLPFSMSWNVSVDNPAGVSVTVTPSSFTLAAGASQTLTFDVDNSAAAPGEWTFGNVWFTPDTNVIYIAVAGRTTTATSPPGTDMPVQFGPSTQHIPFALKNPPADINVTPTTLNQTIVPDDVITDTLNIANTGNGPLTWTIFEDEGPIARGGGWADDFDSYGTGQDLHGVGGWKGWFNDPGASASTSAAQALSAPNSVDINGPSDLVREYTGYTSGTWVYTAYQYIPGSFTGDSYFILLNSYDDGGVDLNWSTQVHFNSATGQVVNDGSSGGVLSLVTDQWVEIRVEIDLDNNSQLFFYNGALLYAGSWTDEVSGGGAVNIGAVDLYANGASSVYYDDLSLQAGAPTCSAPNDIPWLSVDPTGGTTAAGDNVDVTVTYDSTGLSEGSYLGFLCVSSNDPDESLVVVPVNMDVVAALPDIFVDPSSLLATQPGNSQTVALMDIHNEGSGTLNWSIDEDNSPGGSPLLPIGAPVLPSGSGGGTVTIGDGLVLGSSGAAPASGSSVVDLMGPAGSITITHNVDPTTITSPSTVACAAGGGGPTRDNAYLRVFDLNAFGITGAFDITNVQFGVETATLSGATWPVDINLYTLSGPLNYANLTPIGSATVNIDSTGLVLYNVPVSGTAPAGSMLVVELYVPDASPGTDRIFLGSNGAGQTGPSYIASVACGLSQPTDLAAIGFPNVHMIMNVSGDEDTGPTSCDVPEDIPWLSVSPTAGATAGGDFTTVDVTFDSTGLADGVYNAALCVNSDDLDEPVVEVPVTMVVGNPMIAVDPASFSFTEPANTTVNDTLTITNTGNVMLFWSIDEDNSPGGSPLLPIGAPVLPSGSGGGTVTIGDGLVLGSSGAAPASGSSVVDLMGPAGSITITHNVDPTTITSPSTVACAGGGGGPTRDNAYLRVFDLNAFGITDDFDITNVQFGVETATLSGATWPVDINLYTLSGPLNYANLTPIGSATVNIDSTGLVLYNVPVSGLAPAGSMLVVELYVPDASPGTDRIFLGSNGAGQTGPSYIASVACGLSQPTDLAAIGFPNVHMIMNVSGDLGAPVSCDAAEDIPWLSLDATSGMTDAGLSAAVGLTVDTTGLSPDTYTAVLCVNSNATNDPQVQVPVTLTVTP